MNQLLKNTFTLILLVTLTILSISCSSDEIDEDQGSTCDDISATLQATISSDVTSVCSGETAMLTITGTPNSEVSYKEGDDDKTVSLDDTGTVTLEVSPTSTTNYSLAKVMQEDCEKTLTEEIAIAVGGPVISENIIGTWSVYNVHDQTDGETVTFFSDSTGTAPMDGSFTIYSSSFNEYSDGFTWNYEEFDLSPNRMLLKYKFTPIDFLVYYEIDKNDCDEIILRDITNVADPQNTYELTRQ